MPDLEVVRYSASVPPTRKSRNAKSGGGRIARCGLFRAPPRGLRLGRYYPSGTPGNRIYGHSWVILGLLLMEEQGGLSNLRRLRREGNQPQQRTGDERYGNGEAEPCHNGEAEPCRHYQYRGRLRSRRLFRTVLATYSPGENWGERGHREFLL
jgi:hypothetical protein